jgi:hypothetical protein
MKRAVYIFTLRIYTVQYMSEIYSHAIPLDKFFLRKSLKPFFRIGIQLLSSFRIRIRHDFLKYIHFASSSLITFLSCLERALSA